MAFKVTVKSHVNIPKNMAKVQDDKLWTFAANEWWRLISIYTPKDTGNLIGNVEIRPKEIEYKSPYAHYLYEGRAMGPNYYDPDYGFWSPPGQKKHYTGKMLEYHNKNPLSTRQWDKAAKPFQEPKLIKAMQGYIDSGRLNLNE